MKFEKVSEGAYQEAQKSVYQFFGEDGCYCLKYSEIKLPQRATPNSAGYDFYYTGNKEILSPGMGIKFPTGIKVKLDPNAVLLLVPRSSLGFKYRLQLDNTCGVIDSDYYNNPTNEGQIWVKITNDGSFPLNLEPGMAIMQGIIFNYLVTEDDFPKSAPRIGGIGSTDK